MSDKSYVGIPCSVELRDALKILVAQNKCKSYEELIRKIIGLNDDGDDE